ncbi:MAG: hypothetical protein JW958_09755 [Candidatus Eisenbacteria bacterium]|nr:hypothetical protein [Candidatus Eisenbacteria bacterium]
MKHAAVENPWASGRARRRRPRWVRAVFYLGLLLANLSLMFFFSAGAWNGSFLDFYSRLVPAAAETQPEPEEALLEQYPPAENWNGVPVENGKVAPIARPGPPLE